MTSIMIERHKAYGDLMRLVSEAIQDRNDDLLSTLTQESDQIVHDMQSSWSGLLTHLKVHSSAVDRDREIERLTQSLEGSLDKVRNTQKALAQWGSELGASLGTINQGRIAMRGYAIGKGK